MSETARSQSPYPSRSISPWPSPYQSRPASDSPSPSSSFHGDRTLLLARKQTVPFILVSGRPCCRQCSQTRSSSLDDLRMSSTTSGGKHRRSASARNSRRRKESVYSDGRRSSRRASSSMDRSRSGSTRSRRISSAVPIQTPAPTPPPPTYIQTTFEGDVTDEEYLKKHRRHRIAFWLVLASFIFIALSSILVVVVTLTHQSEYNTTVTYYTFAKPSSMVINDQLRSQGE